LHENKKYKNKLYVFLNLKSRRGQVGFSRRRPNHSGLTHGFLFMEVPP